tara:strand:+ start:1347 stop:1715 length:369 start_codon:yes stop_codon:yes gene_type:complete
VIFNNMKFKKHIQEVSSNTGGYSADAGEPDTGWLPGGDARTLGYGNGKPEQWFDSLEYIQVDFPVASYIYGSKKADKKLAYTVNKSAEITVLDNDIKQIDKDFAEIRKNQEELYKDLKRNLK